MSYSYGKYEVRYGSVIDHDTYAYLQLRIYPKTDEPRLADVMLNGEVVGQLWLERNFFYPLKFHKDKDKFLHVKDGRNKAKYDTIGKAVASIISEYVR